jgi:hypothetical protein
MKGNRRLLVGLVCTIAMFGAACGGGTPPADDATKATPSAEPSAAPSAAPTAEPAATPTAAPSAAPTSAPTTAAATPPPAPAPKPGKELIVGTWQFDFSGEPKTKAEEDAKKKAGKDEKKLAALMKEVEEAAAGEWIEFTKDGYYVSHVTEKGKGKDAKPTDKVILKIKYEITKDEKGAVSMKPVGKDEISKKEMKDLGEIPVTIKDDNTIEIKDPKKKMTLVFKRKS